MVEAEGEEAAGGEYVVKDGSCHLDKEGIVLLVEC